MKCFYSVTGEYSCSNMVERFEDGIRIGVKKPDTLTVSLAPIVEEKLKNVDPSDPIARVEASTQLLDELIQKAQADAVSKMKK